MNELIFGRPPVAAVPSPLQGVTEPAAWMHRRRPEILAMYETLVYGKIPPAPHEMRCEVTAERPGVFGGRGTRREVTMIFRQGDREHRAHALWYLPVGVDRPVPAVIGLNFAGNAACTPEPDLPLPDGVERGCQQERWQIPLLLEKGFAVAFAPRNDFFPDHCAGRGESIFNLFEDGIAGELGEAGVTGGAGEAGPVPWAEDRRLTAISAWAWGYSRLRDMVAADPAVDRDRIWAHGHSRLGKTALWAVANDGLFAGSVSNDSGCCGAALFKEKIGETVAFMIEHIPWWSTPEFDRFAGRENDMPFDQHWLAALIAPRPLLIGSASGDLWADPFNEYRCAVAVGEVYRLWGASGIGEASFPRPGHAVMGDRVGYYLRPGKHEVTRQDWEFALEFFRRHGS